ncbi:hypothetical protein QUF80_08570 [Desulfococcaceae bacterium HSG8]|nr:hypothetical protein [Desulfococcaceae bacterium HSG8]
MEDNILGKLTVHKRSGKERFCNKNRELVKFLAAYDLETHDGIKIEIKSAAYVQSWHQKDYSKITFRIPKTR